MLMTLGLIYWLANIAVFAFTGKIMEDIDELEDVKVWHVILGVVFFPVTIFTFLICCLGACYMGIYRLCKKYKPMKWLNKPIFKKKSNKS